MNYLLCMYLFFVFPDPGKSREMDEMEHVRIHYVKAVTDKDICKQMIQELSAQEPINSVKKAYLGAFKMLWAKHSSNPLAKLSTFNAGKKYIENAVREAPENVEIRFIRLSVQKNSPAFLGYKQQIAHDRRFIDLHRDRITSLQLKKMISGIY